jgi:hypothetical protein
MAADGSASIADLQHAALDFGRVSRAVRLTFALQSQLIADARNPARRAETAKAAKAPKDDEESHDGPLVVRFLPPQPEPVIGRKHRVKTSVGRAAEAEGCDAETVERLVREARERLETDDIWAELESLTTEQIIARLCKDLGLQRDWSLCTHEDWVLAEGHRRAPDTPFPENRWSEGLVPLHQRRAGGGPAAARPPNGRPHAQPRSPPGGEAIPGRSPLHARSPPPPADPWLTDGSWLP